MPKPLSPEQRLEWEEKIRQQQASGIPIDRWCHEHQINPNSFNYWKYHSVSKKPLARTSFSELTSSHRTGIEIEYHGLKICLARHFDRAILKECLELLQEISC